MMTVITMLIEMVIAIFIQWDTIKTLIMVQIQFIEISYFTVKYFLGSLLSKN